MATEVVDPYTVMADVIESTILAEFDDLTYLTLKHDRIHESVASDGTTWVGISPEEQPSGNIDLMIEVLIQFYGPWVPDVNPEQEVDPRIVTTYAERLRRALSRERTTATPQVWFFDVTQTRYPSDPTGNKSRFEMTVIGRGQNSGLVETID